MLKRSVAALLTLFLFSTQSIAAIPLKAEEDPAAPSNFPPPKSGKGYNFPKGGRAGDDHHMPFYVNAARYKSFPAPAKTYFIMGALDGMLLGIGLKEDKVSLDFLETCTAPELEELRTSVEESAKRAMIPPPKEPGSNAPPAREAKPAHLAVFFVLRGLCKARGGGFTLHDPPALWQLDQYAGWSPAGQVTYATGVVDGMRIGATNQQKGLVGLDACLKKPFAYQSLDQQVDEIVSKWPAASNAPAAFAVLVASLWNLCTEDRLKTK